MNKSTPTLIVTLFIALLFVDASAQLEFPSLSPLGEVKQQVGFTTIEVSYERPSARDRKIYGGLVPWGKVWRTGAAYCTKVSFSTDVSIEGKVVPAGKYSLFTIPNLDEWTVIFNRDTTLYGSYDYDSQKDIARVSILPQQSTRHYETLTIDIDIVPNNAIMYISWTDITVPVNINTHTDTKVMSYINSELITNKSEDPDQYGLGADYIQFQNGGDQLVFDLAMKAIEKGGGEWPRRLVYEVALKRKNYSNARMMVRSAIDYINNVATYDEDQKKQAIKNWQKMDDDIPK